MKSEEIAKLAGVSRSTVSRVINNYSNVPDTTREKVMKVIKKYNYVPNTFARTLAGKKSHTIGLFFVITGETFQNSRIARNDYFSSYLDDLVDIANSMNYYVLVNTIRVDSDYEKVNRAFLEKRIDGGVIIGTQDDTLSKIHIENIDAPLIVFDYDMDYATQQGYKQTSLYIVNSNDRIGIDKAVAYLKEKGHHSIGFIKGNSMTLSARLRYDGYLKSMKKHNLPINDNYIIDGEFSTKIAYNSMKQAIKSKTLPTAFISSNDYMAIESIRALQENGLVVPDDIAMIGFDNVHLSEQSRPALTTLEPNFYNMAKKAIEILDTNLHKPNTSLQQITEFDVNLVIRESC